MKKIMEAAPSHQLPAGKQASRSLQAGSLRGAGLLFAVAAISFLAWFRLPEVARGTLWAEDAAVFLRETISIGGLESLAAPYAGYLHTVPRIVSAIAYTLGPIEAYAWWMSFLSCVVVACISVGSYVLSGQLFQHRSYRLMIAMIPVLVPVGPLEVLGNAANLHWYLLWLSPWLLIYEPRVWWSRLALFTAALASATTEIIVGMFVPLAAWAVIRRRNYWAPAGLITGLFFQLLATVSKPRYAETPRLDSVDPLSVVYGFLLQAVGSIWETDTRSMGQNVASFGGYAVAIPVVIIFGVLLYVLCCGSLRWRATALYAFIAAAACWSAAVLLNPSSEFAFSTFTKEDWLSHFLFFRYAAAPSMFLLVLFPVACAVAEDRGLFASNSTRYWAPVVMAVFISTSYFQASSVRQSGPEWEQGVHTATEQCAADSSLPEAVIPVAPGPWQVAVPCRVLSGG